MGTRTAFIVERFRALCSRVPGGVDAIADEAGVSAESLRQVLAGVKLPSGNPRGLGPKVVSKIDAAYPGWLTAPAPSNAESSDELSVVERQLIADLRDLLPEQQQRIVAEASEMAKAVRAVLAHHQARLKRHPEMAARSTTSSTAAAKPRIAGDGNPFQGQLLPACFENSMAGERETQLHRKIERSFGRLPTRAAEDADES